MVFAIKKATYQVQMNKKYGFFSNRNYIIVLKNCLILMQFKLISTEQYQYQIMDGKILLLLLLLLHRYIWRWSSVVQSSDFFIFKKHIYWTNKKGQRVIDPGYGLLFIMRCRKRFIKVSHIMLDCCGRPMSSTRVDSFLILHTRGLYNRTYVSVQLETNSCFDIHHAAHAYDQIR